MHATTDIQPETTETQRAQRKNTEPAPPPTSQTRRHEDTKKSQSRLSRRSCFAAKPGPTAHFAHRSPRLTRRTREKKPQITQMNADGPQPTSSTDEYPAVKGPVLAIAFNSAHASSCLCVFVFATCADLGYLGDLWTSWVGGICAHLRYLRFLRGGRVALWFSRIPVETRSVR